MTSALFQALVASSEDAGHHPVVNELPFEPIWFGVIALGAFLALLALLWSFRNSLALDPHGVAEGHHDPDAGRGTSAH
jgi:hypothetical protein